MGLLKNACHDEVCSSHPKIPRLEVEIVPSESPDPWSPYLVLPGQEAPWLRDIKGNIWLFQIGLYIPAWSCTAHILPSCQQNVWQLSLPSQRVSKDGSLNLVAM